MGGYEANFNPPLEDKYKCPVCLTALRDPVQTKCGHRLCSSCFKIIRGGNWYFRCPVDNTWSNHVFEDNAVKREVLSLKVECVNNTSERCDWCGELRELQNHLKNCQYERVECPNKCKSEVMRLDLDKHLLECPLRLETCEHCQVQVVVSQLARHHVLICPKFPLNCPVCGEVEIMRENINGHINIINGDCPMVIVPCSFRHIGCMHSDQRNKMHKHYVDANTHHLMLLSTRLVDLETKHRLDLELCMKKFEQQLGDMKSKLDACEKKNVDLEAELKENRKLLIQQQLINSLNLKQSIGLGCVGLNHHHTTDSTTNLIDAIGSNFLLSSIQQQLQQQSPATIAPVSAQSPASTTTTTTTAAAASSLLLSPSSSNTTTATIPFTTNSSCQTMN